MKDPLAGVPFLDEVGREERLSLLPYLAERTFAPGQRIFQSGDEAQEMLVLLEGQVRVESRGSELCTLGVGEVIGGVSLALVGHRRCGLVALTAVRALALERTAYLRLRTDAPAVALVLQEALVRSFVRAVGVAGIPESLTAPPATVDGSSRAD